MNEFDVVVIGGGAAGLSAALVLTRARRRVAVVDAGQPRNAPAAHMQGFLGSDGLPPTELLAAGRTEVAGYGGHLITGIVTGITPHAPSHPACQRSFDGHPRGRPRTCAPAASWSPPGCATSSRTCPASANAGGATCCTAPTATVTRCATSHSACSAARPEALPHAHLIRQWSHDVVFFANGTALTANQREQLAARAIGVVDAPVASIVVENDRLTGVELSTGQVVPRAAVFVRPRFVPHDTLLTDLGCTTHDNGWVDVDSTGRTSVPGVWAAGNAVNPRAQVITAAGEGSAAAIAINNDLVDEDLPIAVTSFRLGLPL